MFLCGGAQAQQDDYTVERIPVDVTAGSAAAARDQALLKAQREGLDRLAERFGATAPRIPEARAPDYVLSLEIDNEKSSAVRYIAEVTVHYNPSAVNRLLSRSVARPGGAAGPGDDAGGLPPAGAPGAAVASPGTAPANAVLVIPVYEWAGARSLWDRNNPWFLAWARRAPAIMGRPVVLPEGGAADAAALTPEQAVDGDRAAIAALAGRYGTSDAVVAYATYEIDHSTGRPAFRIALNGFGDRLGGAAAREQVIGAPTEFVDELAGRAAVQAAQAMDAARTAPAAASAGAPLSLGQPPASDGGSPFAPDRIERSILLTVPLRGPADLPAVRQQLSRLPMAARDELVALSREHAVLRLHYRGGAERLRVALADGGLLAEDDGAGWTLRRSGPGGAGASPSPATQPTLR